MRHLDSEELFRKKGDTMKIGFIGAGKVGFSLGKLFAQGGIPLTGYYSRQRESSEEAALFTQSTAYSSLEALVKDSDALFLTVPDGSITAVYQALREYDLSGKQICHCSGALSAEQAFPGIRQTGASGYSIHPLFPVSNKYAAYRELAGAFFCLEGDKTHLQAWKARLEGLGPQVQLIPAEGKVRYHAACAIASNLMVGLVAESLSLLEGCGFTEELARQALAPLMRSNLEHLIAHGPVQALTGPVERCDTTTVQKHLDCFPTEGERELYRAVSARVLQVAEQRNPTRDYTSLKQLLEKEQ